MDRLQSMRVFSKIVELGSFTRAGDVLNLSNGVITRHLAELETHLGTRLLHRTTRSLSLTVAGEAYLARVRQILQDIEDADVAVTTDAQNPSGHLRLYSHVGFGQMQLAKLLPLYAARYPDVILDVTLSDHTIDLVENGLDVGIFLDFQKFGANMIARQIGKSNMLLCASPSYLEQHGIPVTPEDIADHVCLNFANEHMRNRWTLKDRDDVVHSIAINSRLHSNSGDVLRQSALAGMGIVVRPSYSIIDDLQSGQLVRLLPQFSNHIHVVMVYPSRRLLSATVRSFVNFMNEYFPHPEADPWLDGLTMSLASNKQK
jgi:DNA-binding transcriptional LysR family regulator